MQNTRLLTSIYSARSIEPGSTARVDKETCNVVAYTTCPGRGSTGLSDQAGTVASLYASKCAHCWAELSRLLAVLVGANKRANIPKVNRVVPSMNVYIPVLWVKRSIAHVVVVSKSCFET